MFSVSPRTVTRWIANGLHYGQASPGAKVLISPDDVEMFLGMKCKAQRNLDAMADEVMAELSSKTPG